MSISSRLARLESSFGGCPDCPPAPVLHVGQEQPDGSVLWNTPDPAPCPRCGKVPEPETTVMEIVVTNHAEAMAALARCQEH
jgi:hypothetical protein